MSTGQPPAPQPANNPVRTLLDLGRAARARGDHVAALEHCAEAAAVAGPGNPWPRLDAAASLRALGRAAEAEATYVAVLADHPGQVEALRGLGQIARARGDHEAALAHLAAAARAAGPGNPWPRLDAATLLRSLGRTAEAEAAYAALLADHPAQVEALLGLGHLARARGDHAAALGHYIAAAAVASAGNPWPRLDQAAALRGLGRAEEAEALCAEVLRDHPGNIQALLGLGLAARDRGDRAAAAAHFRRATEADPRAGAAWIELATELREAGDHAGARAITGRLTAADPADLQAWMSLGRTERAAGRREAALAAFRRAHAARPADPHPLVEMATELRALEQPEAAERHLLLALERDGACLQALEQLGELARLMGDHAAAQARFRQATVIRPASPWAWLGLLRSLSDQGRGAEAAALLAEAAGHCGPAPELEAGRIELLRQQGEWPAALARARAASAAAPRHAGLWIQRFQVERLLGTPAELAACLEAAPVATITDRVRLAQFRGQAAEEGWDIAGALGAYEQALVLRPEDAWALSDLVRARILALDLPGARRDLARLARLTAGEARLQGRSSNLSQTHFGQILDEFALDGAALARLTALRELGPEARIAPLCALVGEVPDYTPAAMLLLIALRQAGRLAGPAAGPAPAIPARIAQYWDSGPPPAEIATLMQGWRTAHPGHGHVLFDDATARAFLQAHCAPEVLAAYRRAREPAQKADIFRLAWLFAEGGWYADADDRCLAPLDSLAPAGGGLVLYQEEYGTIGNNLIGAAPQHPVIGLALELAVGAINRGDADILWFSTGPGLLTRALARVIVGSPLGLSAWLRRLRVLTRSEMHRAVGMHCQVAYKTTERHWSRTAFAHRRCRAGAEAAAA